MKDNDQARLFVALWPPPPVAAELARALPRDLPGVRWQARQRWHITLAFLGTRGVSKEVRRFDRVATPAAEPMRLAGSGEFGNALWIGIETGPWLTAFATQVQRVFDLRERRFQAHLTVARYPGATPGAQQIAARERLADFVSSWWTPETVTLVRSTIGPQAAYEVMGRRPFPAA